MSDNLATLEYPRHLHKGEESCLVHTIDEAQRAVQNGWSVTYVSPDEAKHLAAANAQTPAPTQAFTPPARPAVAPPAPPQKNDFGTMTSPVGKKPA